MWDSSSTWEAYGRCGILVYGRCGILVVHGGVWEVWDSSIWEVWDSCRTWGCIGVGF